MAVSRARVLYGFFPEDGSQITLQQGQIISIYEKDESGWWDGMNEDTGDRGYFPSTYVEELGDYQPASGNAWDGQENYQQPQQGWEEKEEKMMDKPFIEPAKPAAKAQGARGGKQDDIFKKTVTRYGMWANNMCMMNGFGLFIVGVASIVTWVEGTRNGIVFTDLQVIVFFAAVVLGFAVFVVEANVKYRSPTTMPMRGIFYTLFAIPWLLTVYTLFNGVVFLIAAMIHFHAAHRGEAVKIPKKKKGKGVKANSRSFIPCIWIFQYYADKRRSGKCGKETFMYLWIIFNLYFFFDTLIDWYRMLDDRRLRIDDPDLSEADRFLFTYYLPWARAGGTGLNIAYSIILIPVSRTFIRKLYDFSTQNQTCTSKTLRSILWLFPLDKALHFHEKTGWLGLFYAFVHSFAHCVNAGLAWEEVLEFYTWSPLVTGFLLWTLMFMLYPAVLPSVKRGHFEIFWYSHHVFIPFFILCIIHGRGSFGPNYWKWFVVPGSIYIGERIYREFSAYQVVPLLSVTNMSNNVISVEFDKKAFPYGYKEGQYLYLNAPWIAKGQWHPFTISSAPDDPSVTLHIKVGGEKSWTKELGDYLTLMGPKGASWFSLAEKSPEGIIVGKKYGPTGEKILRLYGPHAAPTQHCPEYPVDIIVGSGIGVTPVSSTMQEITNHRWKYNIGTSFPDHAYFCWVCSYRDLEDFRWMIRVIKESQDAVDQLRAVNPDYMGGKTFEVHIWVTSVKDDAKDPGEVEVEDDSRFWGRARKYEGNIERVPSRYSEMDLYRIMKSPPKDQPAQIGDVTIYNGRPKWDVVFTRVADRHVANKIGVPFCGNPRIADDLKVMCRNYTNAKRQQYFILHKENF